MLKELKSKLKGKIIILGIGNTMRGDDGIGPILVNRIKDKVSFVVFDVGISPENYLEKIIKEKPDTVVIIDAVDFGGKPGKIKLLEAKDLKTVNLFSTHNASVLLLINYLQNNLKVDIITLNIQPKSIAFGNELSQELRDTLDELESYFYDAGKIQRCRI